MFDAFLTSSEEIWLLREANRARALRIQCFTVANAVYDSRERMPCPASFLLVWVNTVWKTPRSLATKLGSREETRRHLSPMFHVHNLNTSHLSETSEGTNCSSIRHSDRISTLLRNTPQFSTEPWETVWTVENIFGGLRFRDLEKGDPPKCWPNLKISALLNSPLDWRQVEAIMRRIVWIVENIFGGLRFRDLEKGDPPKCWPNLKISALLNSPLDWRQVKAIMRRIIWIIEKMFGVSVFEVSGLRFRDTPLKPKVDSVSGGSSVGYLELRWSGVYSSCRYFLVHPAVGWTLVALQPYATLALCWVDWIGRDKSLLFCLS